MKVLIVLGCPGVVGVRILAAILAAGMYRYIGGGQAVVGTLVVGRFQGVEGGVATLAVGLC